MQPTKANDVEMEREECHAAPPQVQTALSSSSCREQDNASIPSSPHKSQVHSSESKKHVETLPPSTTSNPAPDHKRRDQHAPLIIGFENNWSSNMSTPSSSQQGPPTHTQQASTHATQSARSKTPSSRLPAVLLLGNPGSGKSTLLSTLVGASCFRSGISLGAGLTRDVETFEYDGMQFVDTPGLEDVHLRERSGRAIQKALSMPAENFRVIFVITLEAGRMRPVDIAMVWFLATAMRKAKMTMPDLAIIINKCDREVQRRLGDRFLYEDMFKPLERLGRINPFPIPLEEHAVGASDTSLTVRSKLYNYVRNVRPCSPPKMRVEIDTSALNIDGHHSREKHGAAGRKSQQKSPANELPSVLEKIIGKITPSTWKTGAESAAHRGKSSNSKQDRYKQAR